MFGSDKEPNKPGNSVDTLIGRQSEVRGDLRFAGGLHVDGTIKGKITADSDKSAVLSVSESGRIEGDIRVPHIVMNGTVEGDVYATSRIQLSAKAVVTGNVYYKVIEMASGAKVNGQLVHQSTEELAVLTNQKAHNDIPTVNLSETSESSDSDKASESAAS